MLIKSRGNMYEWVTHEWRPITGKCPHSCKYCYVTAIQNRYGNIQTTPKLHESELKLDLGKGNYIFVCSTFDLFNDYVPKEWILKVLAYCNKYPENKYLFQSKNPRRMYVLSEFIPHNSLIATTIESDKEHNISKAPNVYERAYFMGELSQNFITCVTIEPILSFNLNELVTIIKTCKPTFVNIGADSKQIKGLDEPSRADVDALIFELKKFTEVKRKTNLDRLMGGKN